MKKITYNMIEDKKDWLESIIKKYNRIAKKHNLEKASIKYGEKTIETVTITLNEGQEDEVVREIPLEVIPTTITYTEPLEENYNNINVLARLDHVENMVNIYSEEVYNYYTLEELKELSPKCDHCKTNRKRNVTYIITMDGKMLQIAKTCLKEQTNIPNIESLMDMVDLLHEIEEDLEDINSQIDGVTYTSKITLYSVANIISVARDIINEYGYVSKKSAYYDYTTSTAERVETAIESGKTGKKDVSSLIEEYLSFDFKKYIKDYEETDNNYFFKMKKILTYDSCSIKFVGVLSSFFVALDSIRKKIEYANKKKIEQHFIGTIGEKLSILATLEKYNIYDNGYGGYTYYYYFKTTQNDSLLWKTSKDLDDLGLAKGQQVILTGTIKDHKEKGQYKTTYITRCKVNKNVA